MDDRSLSGTQRMFRRMTSPELFAAMERESRLWKAECPHCRAQISVWEMGGVRYKAAGEPRKRMRCPTCGQTGWMRIHWTGGDVTALGNRPSVTPLVLKMILFTTIIPLLLIGAVVALLMLVLT